MPRHRLLERALWAIALCCTAAYVGGRTLGEQEHQAALLAFEAALGGVNAATVLPPASAVAAGSVSTPVASTALQPDTGNWAPSRIARYRQAQSRAAIAEALPLAVLSIPRLALQVPVYAELNERNLNRGASLVAAAHGLDDRRNIAIAGHRDGWFRALEGAAVGDLIELQDLAERRRFRVSALHIVEPTDVSLLAPTGESSLTLITCYPFHFAGSAPQRYIVRATAEP